MVKFLAFNARPTTTRFISQSLPQGLLRAFIGRMIADPSFLYKLLLEQVATIGSSVWWELKNRGDRINQEWDLALINVLNVTACNAFVVWSLAPCRSYVNAFQFEIQNKLYQLPNNIFERSYQLREFDLQKRINSFFLKAAEACLVGLTAGAVQGFLTNYLGSKKKYKLAMVKNTFYSFNLFVYFYLFEILLSDCFSHRLTNSISKFGIFGLVDRLSVTIPTIDTTAFGYGAFLGFYANLRYQLLCGFDRVVSSHFDVIGVALFFSTALRMLNVQVGERSRLALLGVEADPLVQLDELLKAYSWPAEDAGESSSSSKWFISKNAMVSGLGLLGIKQGNVESAPKASRKRIVRKKLSASST